MKQILFMVIFFVLSALVLPLMIFFVMQLQDNLNRSDDIKASDNKTISVYFTDEKKVKNMDIDKYLVGVVAAEMPASFENEALKAQAVAARSYALYRKENPSPEHPDAAVCTDSSHCKAYKTEKDLKKMWKSKALEYSKKVANSVQKTKGEILKYDGKTVLAVFHSQAGGGRTENSKDVWGGEIPYLVSVESYGEESAPNFYSTVEVSFEEFKNRIASFDNTIIVNSPQDIGKAEKSEGGSIKSIAIGGVGISGKDMRKIFGLRSSCFNLKADGNSVRFEVMGYGHGVGMSQYGANTMAKEGFNYKQILTHYYTGTQIEGV